jgi:cell filamentation protein
MYDAAIDPYTYENSTVLVDKLDLHDQGELDDFEAEITHARAHEPLPQGKLDFAHFCAIHHHLFQDVFDWAGTPRTVRISKQGSAFCFPDHIEAQATKLFSDLAAKNYLEGLPAKDFAENAAHFLAELNAIHTFRRQRSHAINVLRLVGGWGRPHARPRKARPQRNASRHDRQFRWRRIRTEGGHQRTYKLNETSI